MRVFVGISLESEMKAALLETATLAQRLFPGRYTLKDNYHCTLKFIGDVDEREVLAVQGAMRAVVKSADPFIIELAQLSYFRKPQNAVLFCGLVNCPPLYTLAHSLDLALCEVGFPQEQSPYLPHITLARQARIEPEKLPFMSVSPAHSRVGEVTLFESCRIQNELRYVPLCAYPIGK